jgi:hypothetical protein
MTPRSIRTTEEYNIASLALQSEIVAIALPSHLAGSASLDLLPEIARGYTDGEHPEGLSAFRPLGPVALSLDPCLEDSGANQFWKIAKPSSGFHFHVTRPRNGHAICSRKESPECRSANLA